MKHRSRGPGTELRAAVSEWTDGFGFLAQFLLVSVLVHDSNIYKMAIGIISGFPTFISPDEHKTISASTPASFADIPPVLRHKEQNVSVTLDPPLPGFSSEDGANGTLFVIERCLLSLCSFSCLTLSPQCPRLPVCHRTRLSSRLSLHHSSCHLTRTRWPLHILSARRTSRSPCTRR